MTAAVVFLGLALALAVLHVAAHIFTAADWERHVEQSLTAADWRWVR